MANRPTGLSLVTRGRLPGRNLGLGLRGVLSLVVDTASAANWPCPQATFYLVASPRARVLRLRDPDAALYSLLPPHAHLRSC